MPKISVIIPAYNAMEYLPETLETVLRQTFNDFEVIIVNDGSSDGVEQWIAQVTDSRVQLISQKNQGLAGARNTGIAHSQGEYLAFLDADDLWQPTKLEKQVRCLESNRQAGLVYTWTVLVDQNGIPTGRMFANRTEGNVWKKLTECNIVGCGSVPMVRRCCFETAGVFDCNLGSYVEDWDMWFRIASDYSFVVVAEPLVYYRQLPNSASKNWAAMEQSCRLVLEKAFASASTELLYLKGRGYACANVCLAWKALQSQDQDYKQAAHFLQQAFAYYPQIRFSQEYFRLKIAISLMSWFGVAGYQKFLSFLYAWRRGTRNVFSGSQ
jgi:glycosyltransferase involved in cell wall biosynthesis